MNQPQHARNRKLINPRLQLRLVGACFLVTTLALALQFLLLSFFVTKRASELDGGGGALASQLPGMLLMVLGATLALILPLVLVIGIRMTFRFAGPIYRIEKDLRAMVANGAEHRLKIRDGDEFQSLCDAMNGVLDQRSSASPEQQELKRSA